MFCIITCTILEKEEHSWYVNHVMFSLHIQKSFVFIFMPVLQPEEKNVDPKIMLLICFWNVDFLGDSLFDGRFKYGLLTDMSEFKGSLIYAGHSKGLYYIFISI